MMNNMDTASSTPPNRMAQAIIGMPEVVFLFFVVLFAVMSVLFKPVIIISIIILAIMALRKPILAAYYIVIYHWSELFPIVGEKIEAIRVAVGPVNIAINDGLFALIFLLLLGAIINRSRSIARFLSNPLGKAVALFAFYQLFQFAYSLYLGSALDSAIRESYKYMVCIYALYLYIYFDRYAMRRLLRLSYYLILFLPLFQIYMISIGEVWETSSGTERTYYIGANIFYIAVIIHYMMHKKFDMKTILIVFYMVTGMAMTQYRSAFLALMAVLSLGAIYLTRDGKIDRIILGSFGLIIVTVVGVVILSFVKPDFIGQTIKRYSDTFNTQDRNVVNREYMWDVSMQAFKHNPILGVGSAKSIYSYIQQNTYLSEQEWSPHNFIMRIAAKEGIVGVIFLFLIIYRAYKLISRFRNIEILSEFERRVLLLVLVSLLIIHLMNATFTDSKSNFIFWGLIGYFQILWFSSVDHLKLAKSDSYG